MTRSNPLPYPPPWMDIATLCAHICLSASCVEVWANKGLLPPARLKGGKRMWKWSEVEKYLEGNESGVPVSLDEEAERIRNATREASARA